MKMHHSLTFLPIAALATAAPLYAAATPQEIFAQLAQPRQDQSVSVDKRAAVLPALAYLPADTEALVALPQLGKYLAAYCGASGQDRHVIESMGSAAISGGFGSAKAFTDFIYIAQLISNYYSLDEQSKRWRLMLHQGPVQQVVDEVVKSNREKALDEATRRLNDFRLPPIYCAITPVPGRETELRALYEGLQSTLRKLAEKEGSYWQTEEWHGFSGACAPKETLFGQMLHAACVKENRTGQIQTGHKVHVLAKMQGDAMLIVLCERPDDLTLPTDAESSLLTSSALNGANAHLSDLIATSWMSAGFVPSAQSLKMGSSLLLTTMKEVFEKMAVTDTANSKVYQDAAAGAAKFLAENPSSAPQVKRPCTLQLWWQGEDVVTELVGDSVGMRFAPGGLKQVALAAEPDTMFFFASSGVENAPSRQNKTEGLKEATYSISKGLALCLNEPLQDDICQKFELFEMFGDELSGLGDALQMVSKGLSAPCSFVVKAPKRNKDVVPAVAFGSGVKDRALLSEGWDKLFAQLKQAGNKMGFGELLSLIPIIPQQLGKSATNYVLALPMLAGVQPQVTVSNEYFVAGSSSALNKQMFSGSANSMPFRGVAGVVRFAPIVKYINNMCRDASACTAPMSKVDAIYYAASENDGMFTIRILTDLPSQKPTQPKRQPQ